MFKDVMLPLDGSVLADRALPLAVDVARRCGARLHLVRVHAASVPTAEVVVMSNYDEMIRDWERDSLAAGLKRALDAHVVSTAELLEGPVVDGLQRYTLAADIDLIVMSTHGRSGVARLVLGSVAEHMLRNATAPLLLLQTGTVGEPKELPDLKRILVPLDGTPEAEEILPYAIDFAQLARAEIILLQVAPVPVSAIPAVPVGALPYVPRFGQTWQPKYLDTIRANLPAEIRVREIVLEGFGAADAIVQCATSKDVDLIAMATHGRSGWSRLAHGSVAERVLRHTDTAVLLKRVT
jgi:nucleotide-binding universal stress UspA family protein